MTPVKKTIRAAAKKTVRKLAAPKAKRRTTAQKAAPLKETPLPSAPVSHYAAAVGRRKTAVANVWFNLGLAGQTDVKASFIVNGRDIRTYFPKGNFVDLILAPLARANVGLYAVTCRVHGGGVRGQAEAIRLALCRALVRQEESRRKEFKDIGYLTRDPRMKERKKYGLKKARRAAQWSKR